MADNTTIETQRTETGALDAPTDITELVRVAPDRYREDSDDHVPNPLYSTGTLDTSDTAGSAHGSIEEVSPVFEVARAQNLVTAAKALDPDDATPAELVVLPQGSVTVTGAVRSPGEAREEIAGKLRQLADNPVEIGGTTPGQQAAAEADEDAAERRAGDRDRGTDDSISGAPKTPEQQQPNVTPSTTSGTTAKSGTAAKRPGTRG